jgi:hypothetical protein
MIRTQNFKINILYPLPREEWHGWEGCNTPLKDVVCSDLRSINGLFIVVDGNEICVTQPVENRKTEIRIWHLVLPNNRVARLVARFINPVVLKDFGFEHIGDIDNLEQLGDNGNG